MGTRYTPDGKSLIIEALPKKWDLSTTENDWDISQSHLKWNAEIQSLFIEN